MGGAAFALLPRGARTSKTVGTVYGLAFWALFEVVVATVAGADRERPLEERAALALDHVVYGLVLSADR